MRRTGRTFRKLLGSLKAASEGKHIIYECRGHEMARWTFNKAADIVASFMGKPEIPMPLVLKIGNGTVRFIGEISERDRRGLLLDGKDYEMVTDV